MASFGCAANLSLAVTSNTWLFFWKNDVPICPQKRMVLNSAIKIIVYFLLGWNGDFCQRQWRLLSLCDGSFCVGRQGLDQKYCATVPPTAHFFFFVCLAAIWKMPYKWFEYGCTHTRAMIYSPKPWNARNLISCFAERVNCVALEWDYEKNLQ